jgi:FOG: Ankyrin repeat
MHLVKEAEEGRLDSIIEAFKKYGKQVLENPDSSERTPLIAAVQMRRIEIVEFLLKHNVNLLKLDAYGATALRYAIDNKDHDIVRLIVNKVDPKVFEKDPSVNYIPDKSLQKILKLKIRPVLTDLQARNLIGGILSKILRSPGVEKRILDEYGKEVMDKFLDYEQERCNLSKFFPVETKFINSGVYGAAYFLCLNTDCYPPLAMKIAPYPFNPNGSNYTRLPFENKIRPENVEYRVLHRLNEIFEKLKFPHVVQLYTSIVCDVREGSLLHRYLKQFENNSKALEFRERYMNRMVRITFMEYADMGSLDDYVKSTRDIAQLKQIIFQVIIIMRMIHQREPGFRHNDFHMGNLLLRTHRKDMHYRIDDNHYTIKNPGIAVLINDFDFAFLHNPKENSKYVDMEGLQYPSKYVDMFKFFNHLTSVLEKERLYNLELHKFLEFVIPPSEIRGVHHYPLHEGLGQYDVNYYSVRLTDKEIQKKYNYDPEMRYPEILLRYAFFDEFLNP